MRIPFCCGPIFSVKIKKRKLRVPLLPLSTQRLIDSPSHPLSWLRVPGNTKGRESMQIFLARSVRQMPTLVGSGTAHIARSLSCSARSRTPSSIHCYQNHSSRLSLRYGNLFRPCFQQTWNHHVGDKNLEHGQQIGCRTLMDGIIKFCSFLISFSSILRFPGALFIPLSHNRHL